MTDAQIADVAAYMTAGKSVPEVARRGPGRTGVRACFCIVSVFSV